MKTKAISRRTTQRKEREKKVDRVLFFSVLFSLLLTFFHYRNDDGVLQGKNTVVMSAGPAKNGRYPAILDRSPCGSGTAAVMANLWKKGTLKIGTKFKSKNWQKNEGTHISPIWHVLTTHKNTRSSIALLAFLKN